MGDNDPQPRSARRTVRRRAARALNRNLAIEHLRQQLERREEDGSASDNSGNADSEGEQGSSDQEVAAPPVVVDEDHEDAAPEIVDEDQVDAAPEIVDEDMAEGDASDANNDSDVISSDSDNGIQEPPFADEDVANMSPEEKEAYLKQCLRQWATSGGILSMRKVDELLGMLSYVFKTVPKSFKTLLETDRTVQLNIADDHKMWYKGIAANLDQLILDNYIRVHGRIVIDVNMDGLPLTTKKFWPILGHLVGSAESPFEIAIYCGANDPRDIETFLGDFLVEVESLMRNGYENNGVIVPFVIRNFILDAPARSLVKCCIGHGGYGACEKCCVVGEYAEGRIHFANVPENCPQRTDQSYIAKTDRLHHVGRSPLELLNIGMVSQFRLDTMHLVYKGVFLRLLEAIFTWEGDWNLQPAVLHEISARLLALITSCPRDFNRKPRKIQDYFKLKATELRRLLVYDGIVAFKDKFSQETYSLYLLLHSAIYILCSPHLLDRFVDDAERFIQGFVQYSSDIFGVHFVVYNVHSLTHLAQECRENGPVESFSAFMFENRLKTIKETLRSGYQPLEQIAKRDSERREKRDVKMKSHENSVLLFQPVKGLRQHFKRISVNGIVFKVDSKDGCFMTSDGIVYVLQRIVQRDQNNIILCGKRFNQYDNFYTYPIDSSRLGIFKVWGLNGDAENIELDRIYAKCWLMKLENEEFVSVPLCHSVPVLH